MGPQGATGAGLGNLGHVTTTVDSGGDVGSNPSQAIGIDGFPFISYTDTSNNDLRVMHCSNTACSTHDAPRTLDSTGLVGGQSNVTIGTDGFPIISYLDSGNQDLKVVHCTNVGCSSNDTPRTLDSTGNTGIASGIAIGTDGFAIIAYLNTTNFDSKVVHCSNTACSTNTAPRILDSAGTYGGGASIAIGADGLPIIAYRDITAGSTRITHCTDTACSANDSPRNIEGGVSAFLQALVIGIDGLPVIAYSDSANFDLRVVHCTNIACTANSAPRVLESDISDSSRFTLVIGSDGFPITAVTSTAEDDLYVVRCTDVACATNAPHQIVDGPGSNTPREPRISIGADGLPIIVYNDESPDDLEVLHCSNPSCVPFYRPN